MLEKIQERIKEIENAVQCKASEHAQLLGHLNEAKFMLELAEKLSESGEKTEENMQETASDIPQ